MIQWVTKKEIDVNAIVSVLSILIPQLYRYFTKNKGLNTVTGAAGGSFLTLVLLGMQTASYDQMISFLQNNGETGLIAGCIFAGLRLTVQAYAAAKGK